MQFFLIIHLKNSIDLAINDLCYEYFQDAVCLNSFDCAAVHKKLDAQTDCDI